MASRYALRCGSPQCRLKEGAATNSASYARRLSRSAPGEKCRSSARRKVISAACITPACPCGKRHTASELSHYRESGAILREMRSPQTMPALLGRQYWSFIHECRSYVHGIHVKQTAAPGPTGLLLIDAEHFVLHLIHERVHVPDRVEIVGVTPE